MRLGATLEITEDEEYDVLYGCGADAEKALKQVIRDGRFALDGNSYIPAECVEQFNEAYSRDIPAEDIDIDVEMEEDEWKRRKSLKCCIRTAMRTLWNIFGGSKRRL